jgi:cyanophycinase
MTASEEASTSKTQAGHRAERGRRQGPVMPIGGAEDKGADGGESILRRFVEVAGGRKANILVIPTASESQEEMGEQYIKVFGKLGVNSVDVLKVEKREDANGQAAIDQVEAATIVFITGGSQDRLVELLCGTQVMEAVRGLNANGGIVAGTSAGASILSAHTTLGGTGLAGNSSDAAARKNMV